MVRFLLLVSCCGLSMLGCGDRSHPASDGGADSGPTHACADGFEPGGDACVPSLATCQAGEVPRPGGGCDRVGVRQCQGGLTTATGACEPIGPPAACAEGWAKVAGGWCEPVLPPASTSCAEGTLRVIGSKSCVAIDDCGSGTYGKLTLTSQTIHVDQAYAGGDSDGSLSKPFTTIGAALKSAKYGGEIAVAAGDYVEDLKITAGWTKLRGRCAKLVKIRAASAPLAAIEVYGRATLSGFTVTGPAVERLIWIKAVRATIERVVAAGSSGWGVVVSSGAEVEIEGSLIAGNAKVGLDVYGAKVTLEDAELRGNGYGVQLRAHPTTTKPSTLTMSDSLIVASQLVGLSARGSKATLTGSVIATTGGYGAQAGFDDAAGAGARPQLTVRGSLVAGNKLAGLLLQGAVATVEESVIRDTSSGPAEVLDGAIIAEAHVGRGKATRLTLRRSLLSGNAGAGLVLRASEATLERSVVRDTRPKAVDKSLGIGVVATTQAGATGGSTLKLDRTLLEHNRTVGLFVVASSATLDRAVIRDTKPRELDQSFGDGIQAKRTTDKGWDHPTRVKLTDCQLVDNTHNGLLLVGAGAELRRTSVQGTRPHATEGKWGTGVTIMDPQGLSPTLLLDRCALDGNHTAGIIVRDVAAKVSGSAIRRTRATKAGYGDGVQVGRSGATLALDSTLVARSARAALLFAGSGGSVRRSVLRAGTLSIVLDEDAAPTIDGSNLIEDNKQDAITTGGQVSMAPLPEGL